MPERTLTDIDEEIAAVRAAYLEAVKMSSASTSSGGSSRSIQRQNIDSLRKQLNALNVERSRKSRGGIKIFGGTPVSMLKFDELKVRENVIDRIVRFIDPVKAERRFRTRTALTLSMSYTGISGAKRSLNREDKLGG